MDNYDQSYVSQFLEKSLSKALSFYYPYAGRLKDSSSVDCNDMRVELSNVRVHCPMSQILKHPYTDAEHVAFPVAQPHYHNNEGFLAVAQLIAEVENPTRTEVVNACAVAARRDNIGSFKPSSLFQVAKMRPRLNPLLSQDACGCLISRVYVKTTNERDINCPRLIREMRKEKEKLKESTMKNAIISQVVNFS
ncbi:uncharacterized protein LOC132644133 [Lycium barbarum]|uniref:uncharacterized protein LOC132644133 n=1 Tax=Lycium barbarum TaxID=112863 RepID=UPI00293E3505|nr:uncharacterized protein LOC132644133 [Lycium barbarum]